MTAPHRVAESIPLRKKRQMKATRDGDTLTLTGRYWSATHPMTDLPRLLDWYRGQSERFPKAMGAYDATIAALESLSEK